MNKNIIGIMTGTSLDGIDIYFGSFSDEGFKKIFFETIEYESTILQEITNAIKCKLTLEELTVLNYKIGYEYVRAIKAAFLKHDEIAIDTVDAIAIHGQTIYHVDKEKNGIGATLQIGEPAIIANAFNVPVISDFRANDIATGNSGAPLIYLFDKYIFNDVITLNIGGIANYTCLNDIITAKDTGPGNMIINYLSQKLFNQSYDTNGDYAKEGNINNELLDQLLSDPYFTNNSLTTGREDFGDDYAQNIIDTNQDIDKYDLIATLTELTAISIANEINKLKPAKLVVSGGGVYNSYLMQRLETLMPTKQVITIEKYNINSDEKEAMAFAYFGYMRLMRKRFTLLNNNEALLGKITEV